MKDKGFEESEITKELYTPLVQQQVLPETFVPNAYSEVQKMIATTNKMYMKELQDAEEEETGFRLALGTSPPSYILSVWL